MGNSNSSTLSTKLHELGDLACQLGDDSIGRSLKSISDSPDDIKSLRAVVAAGINRQTQIGSRKLWFQNFIDGNKKLSAKEVDSLASITSGWELNSETLKAVQKDVSKWSRAPSSFLPSNQHGINAVQDSYEDIENIEKTDQPRRKFRLIKLYEILHEKEEKLRSTYKKNHQRRDNNEKQNEGKKLRSLALAEIVKETWGRLSPEVLKEKKEKLAKYCRAGGRWAEIKHKEVILALRNINNKSFERKRLSDLQFIAINSFVSSIFPEEFRTVLQRAYEAIDAKHHRRMSRKRKASSTRITNKRVRRDGVSQASDLNDASGCDERQSSEEPSESDCDDTFSDATSQSTSNDADFHGFAEGEVEGDTSTERGCRPTDGQVTSSDRDQDTDSHQQTSLLVDTETLRIQNPAPQGAYGPLSETTFPLQR
ncbi:hypothetical protein FQN54_009340 [Arachnomyces sp. PD_36]|nr:hypothetical protein FQN54_009340 [Arachnomyces sp. PD_36]